VLQIDPDLKYNCQCKRIRSKISSGLYHKGLKSLYYSLVHSHLIYAIQVWSSTNQSNVNALYKLQKQALRIVHKTAYNAHTESLFKESKILPLPNLIEFFQIQFMHQYLNGHLPILFNDMAITREAYRNMNEAGVIRYQLRNNDDIYLHPARLSSTERAPYYVFPRKWMAFENLDIKILRKKTEFNARL
jgi:hypothetical protein